MVGAGYPFWNPSFVYRFRESLVWGGSDAEQESSTRPAKALDHLHEVRRARRALGEVALGPAQRRPLVRRRLLVSVEVHEPEGVLERDLRSIASDSLSDPEVAAIERTLELGVRMPSRVQERMFSSLPAP
jgi:hypothetical protein